MRARPASRRTTICMSVPSRRQLLRLPLACLGLGLVHAAHGRVAAAAPTVSADEVRGLWVTRSWMTTPAKVAQVVSDASRHGLTALFVQVRGRGDAFYAGGPDPRAILLAGQPPGYDPLDDLVARARSAGLQVHAWLNVNLVAGSTDLPASRQHVLHQHPEWLMVPRALASTLGRVDPRHPRYVSTLAAWSLRNVSRVEGLFTSPIPEGAQAYAVSVVAHLSSRYALDGLHLDYIRYPSPDFDYSTAALQAFRASIVADLTPAELAALDGRAERQPLVFAEYFPTRWLAFRKARLTELVTRLAGSARAARPGIVLTAAVLPDVDDALRHKLQDWPGWLRDGVIQAVCPMMYSSSATTFVRQLTRLRPQPHGTVWPGIGAYKLTPDETARRVGAARDLGFSGLLFYSYDSMTGGAGRPSTYLATLQRRAFRQPAAGSSW